jgi:thymidine kinase
MKKGKLTAVYGPMFSGKTTYLIDQFDRGKSTVVFKPDLDERYTKKPVVVSHNQAMIPAVLVNHLKPEEMKDLVADFKVIMIDEVNFFHESLITMVKQFLREGRDVYVAGLFLDSERNIWGPMTTLIKLADVKVEVTARCDGQGGKCKSPAILSYRKIPKTEQVRVAGVDEYGATCELHYEELHHRPKGQV